MTAFLPPNLLALFAPREPLGFLPPTDQRPWEKKPWSYSGVAQYLEDFEVKKMLLIDIVSRDLINQDPKETPEPTKGETRDERRTRKVVNDGRGLLTLLF